MTNPPYHGLYNEPNVAVLYAMTELVDPNLAQVTVHRSGSVHVTSLGSTIEQMHANTAECERVLHEAGYPVVRAQDHAAHLLYLSPERMTNDD